MPSQPESRRDAVRSLVLGRGLALLLPLLAAVGGGTALATVDRYRAERPAEAAGDSVAVYGPKRFGTPSGGTAYHAERFAVLAGPGTRYALRVVNGAADGAARLDSARVVLNGTTVYAGADVARASGALSRTVLPRADNALEVHAYGPAGAYLTLALVQAPDPSYPVFQRLFRRETGTPVTEVFRFDVSPTAVSPYRVRIENGNPDGTERVSSAQVLVNGTYVLSSNDVNQQVGSVERDVVLRAGENVLEVTLEAKPRGHLNFWITATDGTAPVLAIDAPAAGLITRQTQVEAAGRVQDETATRVTVNGAEAARTGDAFTVAVPLVAEGANQLLYSAVDAAGLRTDSIRTVIRDTEPPVITISAPAEGVLVRDSVVRVRGTIRDRTAVTANVNGTRVVLEADGAFEVEIATPAEGANFLTVTATDAAGNSANLVRQVIRDTKPPVVAFTTPAEGAITRLAHIQVEGTVDDGSAVTVVVNGVAMAVENRAFRGEVPLTVEGRITLAAVATDAAGNTGEAARQVVRDTTPPTLVVATPGEGSATRQAEIAVSGTVADSTAVTLSLNGAPVQAAADGSWSTQAPLAAEGPNALSVVATDAAGNRSEAVRSVLRDTEAPVITTTAPAEGTLIGRTSATVSGTVRDRTAVQVRVEGVAAPVDAAGAFTLEVPLSIEGANTLRVEATDAVGNTGSTVVGVTRDTEPPAITIAAPAEGAVTRDETVAVTGAVRDASAVTATLNGSPLVLGQNGAFTTEIALTQGSNSILLAATDGAGNTSRATRSVTRETPPPVEVNLPPDPAKVASPVNLTAATPMPGTTQFLYTGSTPVQAGVAPGTIDPRRAAILRGRVLNRALQPLAGVDVAIPGHPEFGTTRTRADGWYDLAVNGGGTQRVTFAKDGYLPAGRQAVLPWQDYVILPDVVLIQPDSRRTSITLDSSEPQVARGNVTQDEDGPRQATLIVPPGTGAVIRNPDGSTTPVSALTIRATEYTVGNTGPAAMPGTLPVSSAYTYAVDLRADEAAAVGGTVEFSRPVPLYVENFLDFPVGTIVPVGVYEPGRGAWVPQDNGRVLAILAGPDGVAGVDANGDKLADSPAALAQLGITDDELRVLASTYTPGTTVWRAPVTRTLAVDLNWGFTLLGSDPRSTLSIGCASAKSDPILCQSQAAGQSVSLPGTPHALVYTSNRMPGNETNRTLEIQVTGASVPAELKRVEVEVWVAGRVFLDTLAPAPNLRHTFRWDGKDAYGRGVQGSAPVTVRIGHIYPVVYQVPAEGARSFGLTCYSPATTTSQQCVLPADVRSGTRQEGARNQFLSGTMGGVSPVAQGMGGWTLNNQHVYDPIGRVLYTGDGRRRAGGSGMAVATTIFGFATTSANWCRGGSNFWSGATVAMTVGPDGVVYLAENGRICAVRPDGTVSFIAGMEGYNYNGEADCGVEGRPAKRSLVCDVNGMTVGPDGLLYIAEGTQVRRIEADGTFRNVAGSTRGYGGDGGPALAAQFNGLHGIAFGADGAIYVADRWNNRVRRIGTDGMVATVVGTGTRCESPQWSTAPCNDGALARASHITAPYGVAFGPDGTLYFSDAMRVRRVRQDGTLTTVAGSLNVCWGGSPRCEEGQTATVMAFSENPPRHIAIDRFGVLYFADMAQRIWRVGPDGHATRYVGGPDFVNFKSGSLATASLMRIPYAVALAADGTLYTASSKEHFAVKVAPPGPGYTGSDYRVPSPDGTEVYFFDALGRHLRTVNATTGVTVFSFAYDAAGRMISVTDRDGRATRLERDGAGNVLAVQGPDGQRTSLEMGEGGYLAQVTRPGDTQGNEFAYDGQGLLKAFTDRRGNTTQYGYDASGRMNSWSNPDGSTFSMNSALGGSASTLSASTGLGRTIGTSFSLRSDGGVQNGVSLPGGLNATRTVAPDGTETITAPDGTVTTIQETPDARFGMQSPLRREVVRTPSGLTRTMASGSGVVLANASDPLSLQTRTDSTVVNGRVSTVFYEKAALRVTRSSAAGRRSVARLDSLGRVVEESMPGFEATTTRYDAQGRVEEVRQGTRVQRYGYDAQGRVIRSTDPLNRTTGYQYDAAGRLLVQTFPDGRQVRYRYDAAGNLEAITPPTRPEHQFGFTAANQAESYTPPTLVTGPTVTRNLYNTDGQLRQILRPGGGVVEMRYDSAGRRSVVHLPEGALAFQYDTRTGQLVGASRTGGAALSYGYDGSLLRRVSWSGALTGEVRFRYDSDFRVAAQIVGADSVGFRYDADGLLSGAGALSIARNAQNGLPTGTTLGALSTSQSYNTHGERTGITAAYNGSTLFQTTYTRDGGGRIQSVTEALGGQTRTLEYAYDEAGRLKEVKQDGGVAAVYEYDANGNRERVTTAAGVVEAGIDAQDRLVSYGEATYGYTPSGELLYRAVGSDTTRYRYDALGNLLEVSLPAGSRIEYVVDAENRRVGRKVDGRLVQGFLWEGALRPVAELDSAGAVVARFVYGERPNAPEYMTRGGRTYRLVQDHLGSVRLVVDVSTGEVAQRIDYDAFGQVTQDTRPGFQPFGYAGGLYDERTGLVRFGARDYDARSGRWTAKDPLLFDGGDTHLYGYALSDPLNGSDPGGHRTMLEMGTVVSVLKTFAWNAIPSAIWGCGMGAATAQLEWRQPVSHTPPDGAGVACAKGAGSAVINVAFGMLTGGAANYLRLSGMGGDFLAGCAAGWLTSYSSSELDLTEPENPVADQMISCLLGGAGGAAGGKLTGAAGGARNTGVLQKQILGAVLGGWVSRELDVAKMVAESIGSTGNP